MQSRFIQIKYCSNILIIPELLFVGVSGVSAVLLGGSAWRFCSAVLLGGSSRRARRFFSPPFTICRRMLFCLSCFAGCVNPDVARVASLNGFIYKFVIHYS